ncbi:glutathione peroxidase [Pseudoxanthomonas suwonensis]|uniref:Glutathione peroxidase n=1 Tax=Pseudoxanthomonas suwonensis TaxID=314722 RepID=A0A0E3ULG8_9GAMM|nr:glutathione peroxidase [Pseudoxanthomonas suwonensis]AKC85466.1 glutathione peroxidase [Pseudoxanthomonas suwonensis]
MTCAYDFTATDIDGHERALSEFAGQVLLVVNVASRCGFTPQYAGLERLWRERRNRGFAVLGFPCDQFGQQEPGDEATIRDFCALNYGVTFPMFAKVEVNGPGAHPLWSWLKRERRGLLGTGRIKWNFTKFLVGRDGRVLARYAPRERPEALTSAIDRALAAAS